MPRLKDENKEKKRKDILTAAKKVFLQKGYEPTTIQDIANEVGITRGTMYLYFSGKDDLFQELLLEFEAASMPDPKELLSTHSSVWEVLDTLLLDHAKFVQDIHEHFYPVIFEYHTTAYRTPELRPLLQARYERALAFYVQLFQEGVLREEFQPMLPIEAIARQWITFFDGLACDALHLGPDKIDACAQVASFQKTVLMLLGLGSIPK